MQNSFFNLQENILIHPWLSVGALLLAVWSLVWKGFALWISAHHKSKGWFIALLIFNTLGILEILYIYFFSKTHKK